MTDRKRALDELAEQISENIVAVKGTLELFDTSVAEDDLHALMLKAVERLDTIQLLSNEMLAALRSCFAKIEELKR